MTYTDSDCSAGLRDGDRLRALTPKPVSSETSFDLGDGWEWLERSRGSEVGAWGRDGWDAGEWPLVCFRRYRRKADGLYCYAVRVEGDVSIYRYTTEQDRDRALDLNIEWYWRRQDWSDATEMAEALNLYPFGELPARFYGPFSWARAEKEKDA